MQVPLFRAESSNAENADILLDDDLVASDEEDEDEIMDNIKGQLDRLQAVLDARAAKV